MSTPVKGDDAAAQGILDKFPVFENAEYNKVRCSLTGHELKPTAAELKKYTETKKFLTAFRIHEILDANSDIFEFIENKPMLVGCKVTRRVVAKTPESLEAHLNGKRFKRALARGPREESEDEDESDEEDAGEQGGDGEEEAMDDDSGNMDDGSESDDDADDLEENGEMYPELSKKKKTVTAVDDSYDFAVMDTEMDTIGGRKRKTQGKGTVAMKKKVKKT